MLTAQITSAFIAIAILATMVLIRIINAPPVLELREDMVDGVGHGGVNSGEAVRDNV